MKFGVTGTAFEAEAFDTIISDSHVSPMIGGGFEVGAHGIAFFLDTEANWAKQFAATTYFGHVTLGIVLTF